MVSVAYSQSRGTAACLAPCCTAFSTRRWMFSAAALPIVMAPQSTSPSKGQPCVRALTYPSSDVACKLALGQRACKAIIAQGHQSASVPWGPAPRQSDRRFQHGSPSAPSQYSFGRSFERCLATPSCRPRGVVPSMGTLLSGRFPLYLVEVAIVANNSSILPTQLQHHWGQVVCR